MAARATSFRASDDIVLPPRSTLTFQEVLEAAQRGAPWALEELYRRLAPLVIGYLRRKGACEPEDLVGETFLGALCGIQRFVGGESALRSWILAIAHHKLVDERRRMARRVPVEPLDVTSDAVIGGDAEEDAIDRMGEARVHALLARLAPGQRAVLRLRIMDDLTIAQIAGRLGKRPDAVKALQRRGIAALRQALSMDVRKAQRKIGGEPFVFEQAGDHRGTGGHLHFDENPAQV